MTGMRQNVVGPPGLQKSTYHFDSKDRSVAVGGAVTHLLTHFGETVAASHSRTLMPSQRTPVQLGLDLRRELLGFHEQAVEVGVQHSCDALH